MVHVRTLTLVSLISTRPGHGKLPELRSSCLLTKGTITGHHWSMESPFLVVFSFSFSPRKFLQKRWRQYNSKCFTSDGFLCSTMPSLLPVLVSPHAGIAQRDPCPGRQTTHAPDMIPPVTSSITRPHWLRGLRWMRSTGEAIQPYQQVLPSQLLTEHGSQWFHLESPHSGCLRS